MNEDEDDLRKREAALVAELTRLRARLRQAGVEPRSNAEQAEADRRHARNMNAARAETRAAHAEADELRHRVKNTLAVVQAIANGTLRSGTPLDEARAAFNARLDALSRTHDILFASNWTSATLRAVLEGILGPYANASPSRVRVTGPDIDLAEKPAITLALIFHELATNAAKYGALSNDDGYVEIAWTLASIPDGQEFRLRWHERNGPPVAPPARKGFGSRLIERTLAVEFHGTAQLDFDRDGLACTVRAPAQALH